MRRLRAAGAIPIGITKVPELTIWPFTETRDLGQDPQPVEPRPGAGRLQRGLGRGRRRGARAGGAGLGRRGLDPDPGGVVRPVRAQGAARPDLLHAAARALARDVGARAARAARAGRGPVPRRGCGPCARRRDRGAGARGAVRATRRSDRRAPCASRCPRRCRRWRPRACRPSRARRSRRPPSCCAPSATRSRSATPTTASRSATRCGGICAGSTTTRTAMPNQERLERRTRGMARLGGLDAGRAASRRSRAAEPKVAARVNSLFRDFDVLMTPVTARPAPAVGKWEGRGAIRTLNGAGWHCPFTAMWNFTGQPAAAVPAGLDTRRDADVGPADRAAERRGHAAVAGRADRGRAALGATCARSQLSGRLRRRSRACRPSRTRPGGRRDRARTPRACAARRPPAARTRAPEPRGRARASPRRARRTPAPASCIAKCTCAPPAASLEADLRLPEADAGPAREHPDGVAVRPALDHGRPSVSV